MNNLFYQWSVALSVVYFLFSSFYFNPCLGASWYSTGSGTWGTGGTAQLWNTQPDGSGIFQNGDVLPNNTDDYVIMENHDIQFAGFSSIDCEIANLKMLTNSRLYTNGNSLTSMLILSGIVASIEGTIDMPDTDLLLSPNVTSLFGSGAIIIRKLFINPSTNFSLAINTTVLKDMEASYSNGFQLLSPFQIDSGYKLRIEGSFFVDPDMNINPAFPLYEVRGNMNIEGTLEILGNLDLRSNDVAGMDYQIQVATGGRLTLLNGSSQIIGMPITFAGGGSSYLRVAGTLLSAGSDLFVDPSARAEVIMIDGSTFILSGSSNQVLDGDVTGSSYYDVDIQNMGGTVTLGSNIEVRHILYLTNNGLSLGNYDLNLSNTSLTGLFGSGNAIQNYNATNYIKTNGTGSVSMYLMNGGIPAIFVPVGNSSYNPATLVNQNFLGPITADFFSVRVEDLVWDNGNNGQALSNGFVNRTWYIEEDTPGGQSISLQLFWNASEELPNFDRTNCGITHFNNGTWDVDNSAGNASTLYGQYNRSRAPLNSFSPFSIRNEVSLPVSLIDFNANGSQNQVTLDWATASELNNDYFEIECSTNGKQFFTIGKLNGAGTTTETTNYSFIHHPDQFASKLYYRLKQVDLDGSYTYSDLKIVELFFDANLVHQSIKVYPTMASHHVYLESIAQIPPTVFSIYSDNGQLSFQQKLSWGQSDQQHIDISGWAPGTYYILQESSEHTPHTQVVGTFIKL